MQFCPLAVSQYLEVNRNVVGRRLSGLWRTGYQLQCNVYWELTVCCTIITIFLDDIYSYGS